MPNDLNAKQADPPSIMSPSVASPSLLKFVFWLMICIQHSVIIPGHTLNALVLINESGKQNKVTSSVRLLEGVPDMSHGRLQVPREAVQTRGVVSACPERRGTSLWRLA